MVNPIDPVGVPDTNTNTVTPPTGSEVTNAVDIFSEGVAPLIVALSPELQTILPKDSARHAKVGANEMRVIPMLAQILRSMPALAGDFTADDIDTDMADAAACRLLSQQLSNLVTALDDTARLKSESGWHRSCSVYAAGKSRMAGNKALNEAIGDVQAILARGPRATTSAHNALTAQQSAAAARERSTKADEKAATATARADALQQGTGSATVVQPTAPTTTTR